MFLNIPNNENKLVMPDNSNGFQSGGIMIVINGLCPSLGLTKTDAL